METAENKKLEMLAYEAFIRRASKIDLPFMLKGSYVTRQYFENPMDRIPADLDWVYLEKIDDEPTARKIFNGWATQVTELDLDDNVKYASFKENEFWRRIDYAMADDFPTINTDLKCWVDGIELNFDLDISFNLQIGQPPIPLSYNPLNGKPFTIPNTVPLSLQVSWKIHQTLVRPRFKDLFDLMYLVQHPTFDTKTLDLSLQALLNECKADNVDLNKLKNFLNYELEKLFPNNSINETWDYWRFKINKKNYAGNILYYDKAENITDVNLLPGELTNFLKEFKEILLQKGFTSNLIKDLEITPLKEKIKVNEPFENFKFEEGIAEPTRHEQQNTQTKQELGFWERIKKIFR